MATRAKRQGQRPAISYRITDSTNIFKVTMKKLLAHVNTKMELSSYLARKTLEQGQSREKRVIAWSNQCQASHQEMSHLSNDQEETDTKLILHALDATNAGATDLQIHSPDTDVLVRALRRYPQLCENTVFVNGATQRRRMIPLKLIYDALGEERAAALPGFYAMSGADNPGSFRGKEKPTCWKAFCQSTEDVIAAFTELGTASNVSNATLSGIVCNLYLPNTHFTRVEDVR